MEITLGGLSQLFVILLIIGFSGLFTYDGLMTVEACMTLWGGIMAGMGIGYINGKKS